MTKHKLFILLLFYSLFYPVLHGSNIRIENKDWVISYDESSKSFEYKYQGKLIFSKAYPEAKYESPGKGVISVIPNSFSNVSYSSKSVTDNFGSGITYTIKFENQSDDIRLEQDFYFYNEKPYFLTDVRLISRDSIMSNYLAPIVSNTSVSFLPESNNNRMLQTPWDNDGFVRYSCYSLDTEMTSYEVVTAFNGDNRNGLVVGSVEHDKWKSAIYINASGNNHINKICCYSGASSNYTRDILPHGKIKGNEISSAKMLVGYFEDWRLGMEAFGHANTLIVPSRETWKKGTPFGWNSWGVIAEKINYSAAIDVSNFYKDPLFGMGFHNEDNIVIIDLDSFWDNMTSFSLKQFATRCKNNGQVPGIYWCPFSYWGDNPEAYVEGTNSQYKYKDCFLYVNGVAHKQGGYCVDPTHPAIKQRMTEQFKKFKDWGFEYVKLDFVTNGAIQGDSYYNKNVTTGVQAYNEGFQDLLDAAGDDMYIALSIAPIFPYQYGNSRRVSCDAWGRIGDSEYVMNALSFGWWTDQFYQFNDPDHLVLQSDNKESLGANRARVTSGAITGMFLFGDNFSFNSDRGNPTVSRERALTMMTNPDIIKMAQLGSSFMPVYGYKAEKNGAENFFMYHTDEYLYVACINYYSVIRTISGTIPLGLLNISQNEIEAIKELWTGEGCELKNGELEYVIPACDARVYQIKKKKDGNTIISNRDKSDEVNIYMSSPDIMTIDSSRPITKIEIYNTQGQLLNSIPSNSVFNLKINVSSLQRGICLVKCYHKMDIPSVKKVIVNTRIS